VLTVIQSLVWVAAGWIAWSFRALMVGPGSPEETERTLFAIATFVAATVNAAALMVFLRKLSGWSWSLLTAVLVADVVVTLPLGIGISSWWWLITVIATVALVLLYPLRTPRTLPSG
jgi:membrane protein insertase Oxa1/YidC/SpoIIIJ